MCKKYGITYTSSTKYIYIHCTINPACQGQIIQRYLCLVTFIDRSRISEFSQFTNVGLYDFTSHIYTYCIADLLENSIHHLSTTLST